MVLSQIEALQHLLQQPSLDFFPGVLPVFVCVHAEQDPQATSQAARLLLQQVGFRLAFEPLDGNNHADTPSDTHRYIFFKCQCGEEIKVTRPAFHSRVLCSLLELKALAKWCDSIRQSSSLKSCSEVR